MNLKEYVDNLACHKVYPGDKEVLNKLTHFECGDSKNLRTNTSDKSVPEKMLDRFKDYLSESKRYHDLYYIIENKSTIFLFFSLQTSQLFDADYILPEDVGKLCMLTYGSKGEDEFTSGMVDLNVFKDMLGSYGYGHYAEDDVTVCRTFQVMKKIIEAKESDKQHNLFANSTYPCVELVNFCKNTIADQEWRDAGFMPNLGASLFWIKILPIIEQVSNSVGCTYVSLFAADEDLGGKEKLISYYNQVLFFQSTDKLCAVKPFYDWNCIFLWQEIRELTKRKELFIKEYLIDTNSEDDV